MANKTGPYKSGDKKAKKTKDANVNKAGYLEKADLQGVGERCGFCIVLSFKGVVRSGWGDGVW